MTRPGVSVGQEFPERVAALLPALEARAPEAERLRMLPRETIADFQEALLFRAFQPQRFGGLEIDPVTFFDAVITFGSVCASSAWVLSVLAVHGWHLGLFDPRAQQDVWADDAAALVCSSYAPAGSVERVRDGYVLRGTWPFSSGSDYCQWALVGGIVPGGEDGPASRDDEPGWPDVRVFLIPTAECVLEDNWYVAGLSGSGSKQIRADGVFVPEYRTHRFRDVRTGDSPGLRGDVSSLYRLPLGSMLCYAVAAPVIGVARGMYQMLVENSREQAAVAGRPGREDALLQIRIATTAAELDAVTSRLRENFAVMRSIADGGAEIGLERRSRCRWDAAYAARTATACVDRIFEAAGGRAIFLSNPLQRAFRDAHAMRAHAFNNADNAAQIMARAELGFPNREMLI